MESIRIHVENFNRKAEEIPIVQTISEYLGLPPFYLLILAVSFSIIWLFIGGYVIYACIGIVYPCYQSFKAVDKDNLDDAKFWVVYWMMFGLFRIFDDFAKSLFYWVPLYFLLKIVFLLCLYHPKTRLAIVIFQTTIKPFLKKNEKIIDQSLSFVNKEATKLMKDTKKEVEKHSKIK